MSSPKRKRAKKTYKSPCGHTCNDKLTCKHECCKIGVDEDEAEELAVSPSNSPKRKRKPTPTKMSTGTPCSHQCTDKRMCGHKCCKVGIENVIYPLKRKPSTKTRVTVGPCKHACSDKYTCGHTCCKVGLGLPNETTLFNTDDDLPHHFKEDPEVKAVKTRALKSVKDRGVRVKPPKKPEGRDEDYRDSEEEREVVEEEEEVKVDIKDRKGDYRNDDRMDESRSEELRYESLEVPEVNDTKDVRDDKLWEGNVSANVPVIPEIDMDKKADE